MEFMKDSGRGEGRRRVGGGGEGGGKGYKQQGRALVAMRAEFD